jgi:hypothetical protein
MSEFNYSSTKLTKSESMSHKNNNNNKPKNYENSLARHSSFCDKSTATDDTTKIKYKTQQSLGFNPIISSSSTTTVLLSTNDLSDNENNNNYEETTTTTNEQIQFDNTQESMSKTINFWDLGGYHSVLDRCDNGAKLCNDLKQMLKERASVEKDYSNLLLKFNEKWKKYIDTSREYGDDMRKAWLTLLDSSENTAKIHNELAFKLMNEPKSPVSLIQMFKNENYEKKFHFKQLDSKLSLDKTIELKEGFVKHQKHWADLQARLKSIQKDLNKSAKSNRSFEDEKKDFSLCQQEISEYQPIYMRNIKAVFNSAQSFEEKRMDKFIYIFKICNEYLRIHGGDLRFEKCYRTIADTLNKLQPKNDLDKWSAKYGIGSQ